MLFNCRDHHFVASALVRILALGGAQGLGSFWQLTAQDKFLRQSKSQRCPFGISCRLKSGKSANYPRCFLTIT